jgi:hypothetical protein
VNRARVLACATIALLALAGCGPAGSRAADGTAATAAARTRTTESPETSAGRPTATPTGRPTAQPAGERWTPAPGSTWQYQLSGDLDLSVPADVYDVDWQDTDVADVRTLHAAGRHVICYVNAGAYEKWRPDAAAYPADVLGEPLDGWPGERWVDVRRLDALLPVIAARMDVCRAKGFDAVEADNVDGYLNETGFDLGGSDQVQFNTAVARLAHERGLAIGLKNDVEQVATLEAQFDFAVNEECLVYDECDQYRPFLDAGKVVFHVEYAEPSARRCARAGRLGLSTVVKGLDLDAPLHRC